MPFTASAKNIMLDAIARATAPSSSIDRVGAFQADAGKAVTGVTATDIFTSAAHGFAAGNIVTFSATTGATGIIVGRIYFVIAANLAANTFQVSDTPAGTAIDLVTDMTAGTVVRYVEITGGAPAYARKAIAWNAPGNGTIDDSTNGAVLDIPAAGKVDAVGGWNNTSGVLLLLNPVTQSTDAAQWTYTVTDADLTISD